MQTGNLNKLPLHFFLKIWIEHTQSHTEIIFHCYYFPPPRMGTHCHTVQSIGDDGLIYGKLRITGGHILAQRGKHENIRETKRIPKSEQVQVLDPL